MISVLFRLDNIGLVTFLAELLSYGLVVMNSVGDEKHVYDILKRECS